MGEFTVLFDGGAKFYQRFYFTRRHKTGRDFLSRLIAINITDKGIFPIYLPLFTLEVKTKHLSIWINLSRWKNIILLMDSNGIQAKYNDVRKEFDNPTSD